MNNAAIFKQAHTLTKATVKTGDSYQATFALCLKLVIEQNKAQAVAMVESKEKARMNIKAIVHTIPKALYQFTVSGVCVMLFAFMAVVCLSIALGTSHAWLSVVGGFIAVSSVMFGMFIVSEAIENIRSGGSIEKAYSF